MGNHFDGALVVSPYKRHGDASSVELRNDANGVKSRVISQLKHSKLESRDKQKAVRPFERKNYTYGQASADCRFGFPDEAPGEGPGRDMRRDASFRVKPESSPLSSFSTWKYRSGHTSFDSVHNRFRPACQLRLKHQKRRGHRDVWSWEPCTQLHG